MNNRKRRWENQKCHKMLQIEKCEAQMDIRWICRGYIVSLYSLSIYNREDLYSSTFPKPAASTDDSAGFKRHF
jgi:hypothetical protein